MQKWDMEVEVAVIGSGGGALTAALSAHEAGAKIVVLERTDKVGGNTAQSGGAIWIPMNKHMEELGVSDSREEALKYCLALTEGRTDDNVVEAYVDNAVKALEFIETKTPVCFKSLVMPDYHAEVPGGKVPGRGLDPQLYDLNELGEWKDKIRSYGVPIMNNMTTEEQFTEWKMTLNPSNIPVDVLIDRMDKGLVGRGNALIGGLLKGCLDRKIPIRLETRALELVMDGKAVIGVKAQKDGKDLYVKAPGGVILACGGFEWNDDLKNRYLQGKIDGPVVQPHNEGDGTMMASEAGADMIQMHEVWWFPSVHVPGDRYDGKPFYMMCFTERHTPHTILVNKMGRRFVNEAGTYNDMAKAMFTPDENSYGYRNYPCWAVMDSQYREKYHVMGVLPGDSDPEWLMAADTLEELADKVGIDPAGLVETVNRYNDFCRNGKDLDWGRGENLYECFVGDPDAPHPVLGTVEKAPFYVVPVLSGALGTKGGPRIDKNGQARNVRNLPITGLYACGNVAAPVSGPGYWGPGGTIGPGVCFGYLAGIHAAQEAKARR